MVEFSQDILDATYHSISDPTRRDILKHLAAGPARITDLAGPREISFAATSKHVRVLEGAGLIQRSITGREHWLELQPSNLHSASLWLDGYRAFWEARLDRLEHELRERQR